ncbi:MAG: aconitate hydratase [Synergistales bacterium]|nr:aconitate hydratase [Synergistales bacterium]
MGQTLCEKIMGGHIVEGAWGPGKPLAIRIDQTLSQDATGTMANLEFEAMGVDRVQTELSVSYVDHNMVQQDFKNPDDHRFMQDIAAKYGMVYSPPGNGICHQVHLERFARPGRTLLGCDSHTPTAGGAGMIAIGSGGLDVAMAMAGEPFWVTTPKVVGIKLSGSLPPCVSAKDVILEVLRRIGVKGGVGKVLEYFGPGVESLSVPERATITNMGAETGATTSLFPSDSRTRQWLAVQQREEQWTPMQGDGEEDYDEIIEIDLSSLEPLVAQPFQPDNVVPVAEIEGMAVDQVMFGSCTNSSLRDIMAVAHLLEGNRVSHAVDAGISPGSRQVLRAAEDAGALKTLIASGVRLLEVSCGACIGMGFAPPTEGVSLRTINRNFLGRCGHKSGRVYLVSPEVAAASAVSGTLTDPRRYSEENGFDRFVFALPGRLPVDDSGFIFPPEEARGAEVEVRRGPNIAPLPEMNPLEEEVNSEVLLKLGDDITTDHIMPAGTRVLPFRSNIPVISKFVFEVVDETFPDRALKAGNGCLVGGHNYGQGSSREHAALAPRYLGVRMVIAKSFARIHLANLVNFGILPLVFEDESDYDRVDQGHGLSIRREELVISAPLTVRDTTTGASFRCTIPLSERDLEMIRLGGKLNWIKEKHSQA